MKGKKTFHKGNLGSVVHTSGSDPQGSDISSSNHEPDMTSMVPDSLSESAPKSTINRKSTPCPQPIRALQGLFSKLCSRSAVSSKESGAQCLDEEPVGQSLEEAVQPDGEISPRTDAQEQSLSPGKGRAKSACHEEMTLEVPAKASKVMGASPDTMEEHTRERAVSEDILQDVPGSPDHENTLDRISCEPLDVKVNVCATIKRKMLPSILRGSTKTGSGLKQKGKIQGKIKNVMLSTLGKNEPKKTTPTSAETSQMTETQHLEEDNEESTKVQLSKAQVSKKNSGTSQIRRRTSREGIHKKPRQSMQEPSRAKTKESTSKPHSLNAEDSHRERGPSVPAAGQAQPSGSRGRDTKQPTQESSGGIQTTNGTTKQDTKKTFKEAQHDRPERKPRPSISEKSMETTKRRNTTSSGTVHAQAHKPVQEPDKARTNHTSSRRNTSTTEVRRSSTQKPVTNSLVQSKSAHVQKPQPDPQRVQSRTGSIKASTMSSEDQTRRPHQSMEHLSRVKDNERRHSTKEKTKPAPADQDRAEAQDPSSKKKTTSSSKNKHAEDLATVVPGKPLTMSKK